MQSSRHRLSRRELGGALAAGAGLAALPGAAQGARAPRDADLIGAENAKPGTRDWMLTKAEIDPATRYRSPWIEGFCSHLSAKAGEEITFFVSANPPSPVTLSIYRLGYYGGDGGLGVGLAGGLIGGMMLGAAMDGGDGGWGGDGGGWGGDGGGWD